MEITKPRRLPELRAWMKRTETSQRTLARALDLGDAQISKYLNGDRNLSLDMTCKLALLTDIPVEKLLTGGDAARLLKLLGKQRTSAINNNPEKSNVA